MVIRLEWLDVAPTAILSFAICGGGYFLFRDGLFGECRNVNGFPSGNGTCLSYLRHSHDGVLI